MLEQALEYVEKGWYVFPLKPRDKVPDTTHGFKDASNDPDQIRKWWKQMPNANIGLACGPSGLVVIDLDVKPDCDGREVWQELCQKHDIEVNTVMSLTGNGGQHLIFKAPQYVEIRNSQSLLGRNIDVKANGGYIVLPPSIHPNGKQYMWELSSHPDDIEIMPLPKILIELLQKDKSDDSGLSKQLPDVIPEGQRDDTLMRFGCSMRRWGASEETIFAALWVENANRCEPLMPEKDIRKIAVSVCKYEPSVLSNGKIITPEGEKSIIRYVTNRDQITLLFNEILNKIIPTKKFFTFGDDIVYIEPGKCITAMDTDNLNGHLLKYFEIMNVTINKEDKERLANYQVISRNHLNMFLSSPEIKDGLLHLESYTKAPVFDKDWKLISQPGYHPDQKIYYDGPHIEPSYSTNRIDEMLQDVHWKGNEDKANFIGMILTGLSINKWIGRHPMMALNGNKSQVGKSTLAGMLGIILEGKIPSNISYDPNQSEFEKALATEVDNGSQVIIIDNVKGKSTSSILSSSVLERNITAYYLNFRRLGSNTNIKRPNTVIFVTTMNDSKLSKDLQNRDIPINLEIYERTQDIKYSIPDIESWILDNRLEIVSEALGMICRWVEKGCPIESDASHSISREWAMTIDSILKTCKRRAKIVPGGGRKLYHSGVKLTTPKRGSQSNYELF